MIVLDTNVVSELMKPSPSAVVASWVRRRRGGELYTTSISVAEVRYGIARLPAGARRDVLARIADELFDTFAEQILPFDTAAAREYADIVVGRERAGRPVDGFDAQVASICRARGAAVATRNVRDFRDVGIAVLDPRLAD
jgi:predicted nucleic acid-binding protein